MKLPIKYAPFAFEAQIAEMCHDLTIFIEQHGSMDQNINASRLREELAQFHSTTLKQLKADHEKHRRMAA